VPTTLEGHQSQTRINWIKSRIKDRAKRAPGGGIPGM
jgi:hypothetical protein